MVMVLTSIFARGARPENKNIFARGAPEYKIFARGAPEKKDIVAKCNMR